MLYALYTLRTATFKINWNQERSRLISKARAEQGLEHDETHRYLTQRFPTRGRHSPFQHGFKRSGNSALNHLTLHDTSTAFQECISYRQALLPISK